MWGLTTEFTQKNVSLKQWSVISKQLSEAYL